MELLIEFAINRPHLYSRQHCSITVHTTCTTELVSVSALTNALAFMFVGSLINA
jgi:hypothetical protein